MSRKVCVVTGSRAEYGLLRWVMEEVREAPDLTLQVVVTGAHLAAEFGFTYREIEHDGFVIDRRVETLLSSDTPVGVAKSMALGLMGIGEALQELAPDIVVVLGDRFEIFSAAAAALIGRIPVAHLHGGETSEGAFDEALRHSITKMSSLHFVAAEPYRRRVIQLGEQPERVFQVGGLGIDGIKRLPLMDRPTLEASLGVQLGARNLLVTFHPVTLEDSTAGDQVNELLAALEGLIDTQLVFTMPNADTGGRVIIERLREFAERHDNAHLFSSLGQLRYLSCIAHMDGLVGNSSSGLTEVPTFRKGTINIGDRQAGRLKAESVIDCEPNRHSIARALQTLYSAPFAARLATVANPYGDGGASEKIVKVLRDHPLDSIVKKRFFDLPQEGYAHD